MARIQCDGNTKVTWVPAIANINAPSAASELNAGTAVDFQPWITPDGLNITLSEGMVDASVLASIADFELPGRNKIGIDFTCQRDGTPANDKAYNTAVAGTLGYIVIRRNKLEGTAYAAADVVEVYPMAFGRRLNEKPTKNGMALFKVSLYRYAKDNDNATVAA